MYRNLMYIICPWGRWSSGKYVGTTCLRAAGFESRSSRRVGILASDMACGVVRQGFDPGLQVFLRECISVAAQTRSCLQGLDTRA
jgi:hypothetical protein